MKLIVTVLLVGLSSMGVVAQNTTLTYSRTLLVDNNTATVPTGHVWKVEGAVASSAPRTTTGSWTSWPTVGNDFMILINGNQTNISKPSVGGSAGTNTSSMSSGVITAIDHETFPLWLPAGTTLATGTNIRYLSVIEFKENP